MLTQGNFDTTKMQVNALLLKNETWDGVSGNIKRPNVIADDIASINAGNTKSTYIIFSNQKDLGKKLYIQRNSCTVESRNILSVGTEIIKS